MVNTESKVTEPSFMPGLELSESFYRAAVLPALSQHGFHHLKHSAGLLDSGSEVFSCDTIRSTDHNWGPRVNIFLTQSDYTAYSKQLHQVLSHHLPTQFRGFSTHFGRPDEAGTRGLEKVECGPVDHRVEFYTVSSFCLKWLNGFDPELGKISLDQWRRCPRQVLFSIRNGRLFRDDLGVEAWRDSLHFYPWIIWIEELIAEWAAIAEEEAFVGRTGELGDELGSRLIASRLLNRLMKIIFLLEKEYYPYSKWFGTVFSRLKSAPHLIPLIEGAVRAEGWKSRESFLSQLYIEVIQYQNAISELPMVDPEVSDFHDRPFQVPHAGRIVCALKEIKSSDLSCSRKRDVKNKAHPGNVPDDFSNLAGS